MGVMQQSACLVVNQSMSYGFPLKSAWFRLQIQFHSISVFNIPPSKDELALKNSIICMVVVVFFSFDI